VSFDSFHNPHHITPFSSFLATLQMLEFKVELVQLNAKNIDYLTKLPTGKWLKARSLEWLPLLITF